MTDTAYVPISDTVTAEQIMATTQSAQQQVEGLGLRIGNRAEFTLIAPVLQPDGAKVFKEHVAKAQAEAAYWEGTVATVHDLRVGLINDDTQIFFAATYSDDFKPYVADVIKFATPWIDYMFIGVADGYPGLESPDAIPYILKYTVQASVWYASNPQASVRDITRALQLSATFEQLLDIAQG
jgi:hypothetical protein